MGGFQDMPPPGGFGSINVERTLPRPIIRQGIWLGILLVMTVNGPFVLKEMQKKHKILKIEQTEHFIAAHPFLVAEQERKFLRFLRLLREQEKELMKDYPGWKFATFFGEPVFKTLLKDTLPNISQYDWLAHNSGSDWQKHVVIPDNHQ